MSLHDAFRKSLRARGRRDVQGVQCWDGARHPARAPCVLSLQCLHFPWKWVQAAAPHMAQDFIDDDMIVFSCWSFWTSELWAINAPGDKCTYQDLGSSQKKSICLRRRKRHDILHIKIDYFINRLIENQAAEFTSCLYIPTVMGTQSLKNAKREKRFSAQGLPPLPEGGPA